MDGTPSEVEKERIGLLNQVYNIQESTSNKKVAIVVVSSASLLLYTRPYKAFAMKAGFLNQILYLLHQEKENSEKMTLIVEVKTGKMIRFSRRWEMWLNVYEHVVLNVREYLSIVVLNYS